MFVPRLFWVVFYIYKLASPRQAFYLATFFSIILIYNVNDKRRLSRQSGWGILVYAPGWSLASQF